MRMTAFTVLALSRRAIAFTFGVKRLTRLLAVPCLTVFVLLLAESFYPMFSLAEKAELQMDVHPSMIVAVVFVLAYLVLSLMLRVQKTVFFGEGEGTRKFFVPLPDMALADYYLQAVRVGFGAMCLAAVVIGVLTAVLAMLEPLPVAAPAYAVLGVAALMPYFSIRFSLCLPAGVAGEKMKLRDSWRKTARVGSLIALLYALFLLLPLVGAAVLYRLVLSVTDYYAVTYFAANFFALCSLLFSSVLQSAFAAYLYSAVRSDE